MSIFKPRTVQVQTAPPAPTMRTVAIVVRDDQGAPLPTAVIVTSPDFGFPMVNGDGYSATQVPASQPALTIQVSAAGYVTDVHLETLGAGNYQCEVRLQPDVLPFPTAPGRIGVLTARVGFQGVSVQTQQFGTLRAWGPELGCLTNDDADGYVRQVLAAGFTAVEFAVSWNYAGPTFRYPVPGSDLSQNLPELKRRIVRAIRVGAPLGLKAVFLFCAGDGESNPAGGYNDPGGWTYGRAWLMANFRRIYDALGPQDGDPIDVRDWIVFVPGYDACDAYQWTSGDHVVDWWHLQRSILDRGGKGYSGFEWPAGQCQLGDGFPTYTPENAGCVDVWLLELPPGPYPPRDAQSIKQITQQLNRMCQVYHLPAWALDDFERRYYGPFNTPRGSGVVQLYEFDTYGWVRGMPAAQVDADRSVLQTLAPETILC